MRLRLLIEDREDIDQLMIFLEKARNLAVEVTVPIPDLEPLRAAIGEPRIIFMDEGQSVSFFVHAPMEIVEPES